MTKPKQKTLSRKRLAEKAAMDWGRMGKNARLFYLDRKKYRKNVIHQENLT